MQETLLKYILKEDYHKTLWKVNLIFSFAPSPLLWTRLWKTKTCGISYQSLFALSRTIHFLVNHQSHFWWFNTKWFPNSSKILSAKLCEVIFNIIIVHVSSILLNLETMGREIITKKGISHKQKELFNWNKKYLQQFLRWFILVNSKNLSIRVLNWLKHGARNNFYWIT